MQKYCNYESRLTELGGGEGSGSAINICCKTVSGLSLSLQRILYAGIFVPLLVMGDVKGSIEDQNKAISLNPTEIDPYINRGIAEEASGLWSQAKKDYMFVISQDSKNFSALYNLANVEGSTSHWQKARDLFSKAALYNPGFAMARSSMALADFQLGNIDESEKELKKLIRRYPTFADARAALTALNWSKGESGKAESNWIAVTELDPRYSDEEWLKKIRRWPPQPIGDLMNFIDLK